MSAKKNGVRANLTEARERGQVENKEFAAFAKRILRAFSRRVAQGDVEALTDLLAFERDLQGAIQDAVSITPAKARHPLSPLLGRVLPLRNRRRHDRLAEARRHGGSCSQRSVTPRSSVCRTRFFNRTARC